MPKVIAGSWREEHRISGGHGYRCPRGCFCKLHPTTALRVDKRRRRCSVDINRYCPLVHVEHARAIEWSPFPAIRRRRRKPLQGKDLRIYLGIQVDPHRGLEYDRRKRANLHLDDPAVLNVENIELAPNSRERRKTEPEKTTRLGAASHHACHSPVAIADDILDLELKFRKVLVKVGEVLLETRTIGRDSGRGCVGDGIRRYNAVEGREVAAAKHLVNRIVEIEDDLIVLPCDWRQE